MHKNAVPLRDIRRAIVPELKKGGAILAILFGSYARGEADQYSDLDLLIVAESTRPFVERFKDFLAVLRVSPVKSIDMLIYTPAEFRAMQEAENSFVSKALREGKVIYEARPKHGSGALAAASRKRSGRG